MSQPEAVAMAKDVNKGSHVVVIGQSGYRKAEHRDSSGQFRFYTMEDKVTSISLLIKVVNNFVIDRLADHSFRTVKISIFCFENPN